MEQDKNIPTQHTGTPPGDAPAQKNKKPMMIALTLLLLASLFGNVFLFVLYRSESETAQRFEQAFSEEFFHYNSLTVQTFEDMVASGEDFAVIVSRPDCGACIAIYEDVMAFTEEMGINDDVYFLNVHHLRKDEQAWQAFKEKYNLEGTPTYARYADGAQLSRAQWDEERGLNAEDAQAWFEQQSELWD